MFRNFQDSAITLPWEICHFCEPVGFSKIYVKSWAYKGGPADNQTYDDDTPFGEGVIVKFYDFLRSPKPLQTHETFN